MPEMDKMTVCRERMMRTICSIAAAILIAVALPRISAVNELPIMGSEVTGENVVLYLGGTTGEQSAEAQIGTEPVGSVKVQVLDASTPIVTWLLMDNSLSIAKTDREKANQLMTDIAAGRLPNERITFCTISDHLHIVLRESTSYAELKTQIDGIQYENQETYLTDVLSELLDEELKRTESAYVRCIVISDGVDNNPGGITRDELSKRLSDKNLPIYTFGCKGGDSELKAMYAISRQTCAKYWAMSELTDTLSVSATLGTDELPARVSILIPETLRDGTAKGVRVVLADGSAAETQLKMPFGIVTRQDPPPEPQPEPAPTEPEPPAPASAPPETEPPNKMGVWLPIGIGVVCLAAICALLVFLLRKKKAKNRVRTVSEGSVDAQNAEASETEFLGVGRAESSGTMILIGNDRSFMLSLTDTERPQMRFEVPLRDKVTVGRNSANQIVINYDKSVSGSHCEIVVSGNTLQINDLHSKNGTYVDGVQVIGSAEIANGSTIKLGRVVLKVGIR